MSYETTPVARRLATYKRKAAESVATILRNWPEGEVRDSWIAMRSDWRAHRYPAMHPGGNWQDATGSSREFYIYSFDKLGWRQCGRADEVAKRQGYSRAVDHTGWFVDALQSETVAGYVLQIPARDGKSQYVPAIAWTDRDGVTVFPLDRYDSPLHCALSADRYAERAAEANREWSEAFDAGQRASELTEEIATTRREALALLRELRPIRKAGGINAPTICARLRSDIDSLLERIGEARSKRADLWAQIPTRLEPAFCDGFGGEFRP